MSGKGLTMILVVAVLFVAAILVVLFAWGGMGYMMGSWMMGGGFIGVGIIIFLLLVGGGVYLLLIEYGKSARDKNDSALTITKERYARGELTFEEFEKIKRDLSST